MTLLTLLACLTTPAAETVTLTWFAEELDACDDTLYTEWEPPTDATPVHVSFRRVHDDGRVSWIANTTTNDDGEVLVDCEGEDDAITVTFALIAGEEEP